MRAPGAVRPLCLAQLPAQSRVTFWLPTAAGKSLQAVPGLPRVLLNREETAESTNNVFQRLSITGGFMVFTF